MKYVITEERPMSWSSLSSFDWDPSAWYRRYILGEEQTSPEMTFGSMVDKRLQDDPLYLPHVPRYPLMQHVMRGTVSGIPIIGVPDGLNLAEPNLADYKTGKKPWTIKRANETGQLTWYLLLIELTEKIKPEAFDCFIHWLPTANHPDFTINFRNPDDPELITFRTTRSSLDTLMFRKRITDTYKAMQEYVEAHE